MLTGGNDDEAEEPAAECSTKNVMLFSDVDISDTLPTSSALSQANKAKCLLKTM